MNILVAGGGGREHAIIAKLLKSPGCGKIYAAPGNGGIAELAECTGIKATDTAAIVRFAVQNKIDYAVVTPDDPLVLGLVDMLLEQGIPAFGPSKAAARIEGSKAFAKDLMKRHSIPTAAYESFSDINTALAYLESQKDFPVVVKADGLALGKGVIIAQNLTQAKEAVCSMMRDKRFGESGSSVVIEEYMQGPEVSVLAFTDGKTLIPMVSSMDYKRAFDGSLGPNTGGMGAIAPNPYYTAEIADECMRDIFLPTIHAMRGEGCPFSGCLYFGLMLTSKGPRVVEYNCRFGDPETQVVLQLLESDLLEIMLACTNGNLTPDMVRFGGDAVACVCIASGGYPGEYNTGYPVHGIKAAGKIPGVTVFHAGTKRDESGGIITSGGRVLGVTGIAGSASAALGKAYAAVNEISFTHAFYRTDIGKS
ncbi:MAG: phosphoribosylamine--glycine ligase [Oscillospiraceae bacterium]|nr:phosphoribosylamine--glycine ligase [Oscillospiraceae bacterium]